MIGFLSVVIGVSAFEVFTISKVPSGVSTNRVHPDPKFPIAEFVNVVWNVSILPRCAIIAAASVPIGALFSAAACRFSQ